MKARLILALTEQVSEDDFERHHRTIVIDVPESDTINEETLKKCDIIGGEWIDEGGNNYEV